MIRAGEGTRVRGAVTARLLDRIHGQALAELYEVTFSTRAPTDALQYWFNLRPRVARAP